MCWGSGSRGEARQFILSAFMLKWLFTLLIALAILSIATPWLARLGVGRLPGDLRFRLRGREYAIPFASSVVLSLLAWAIASLL
jgi:hypothetical protein